MTSVVRLINGGTVQVRTGVLAGVGPEGPRGLIGPVGPDGAQGPTGETGAMGQILKRQTRVNVSSTTSVTADTETLVAFGTVAYDDMSAHTSTTAFTLSQIGDYMFSIWVRFDKPANAGDGARVLRLFSSQSGNVAYASTPAVDDAPTYATLTYPVRTTTANEVFNVYALSGDDLSVGISAGAITITAIGSGPAGPAGPAGPQGPTGATGAQGPQGTAGSANSGFATYADLL